MKKVLILILILFLSISLYFVFSKKDKISKKDRIKVDNIFLITIDTLRADHLGCYDYPRDTSPFIDSLAKRGILFKKAYSQSATTCPSHASIFTGLYPSQHKVIDNAFVLDDSYITLAEILKEDGFRTVGITSTDRHFLASNLIQGLEFYEEPKDTVKIYGFKYRQATHTINNAIMWLYNFDIKEKLFMWIHLFDPHLPYNPPEGYYELMEKEVRKEGFIKFLEKFYINHEVFDNDNEKMFSHLTSYDAEIRYVDEEIKRFFDFAEEKGLNKNSLWIITSDHGEALGQHYWLWHGKTLYQEAIHVPLIFFFSQGIIPPSKIESVSEISAIFPTLLDILDIRLLRDLEKEIKAVSLFDEMKNEFDLMNKYAFSERQFYEERNYPEDTPLWKRRFEEGDKYSVQTKKFKYIYNTVLGEELYDLQSDPFETNNIANKKHSTNQARLKKMILTNIELFKKYKDRKTKKVDKKTIERLRSLGYIH